MTKEIALALLYQALEEPIGLLLQTSDTTRAKALFYSVRAAASDPTLARLQLRSWGGPDGNLALVKGPPPAAGRAELGDLLA